MDSRIDSLRVPLRQVGEQLKLPIDEAQVETLVAYLALLQRWNSHYNLTAVRDPAQMLSQHLADCLAIIGPLRRELDRGKSSLLDVGSGGGLPGVVIAAMVPELEVTCVDAVGKKAAFVRQTAGELHLKNLKAHHGRVEQLGAGPWHFVTSRAFASLGDFASLTGPCLTPNGRWLAMKGKVPTDEIALLPATVDVFHVEQLVVPGLQADRCIVWMRPRPG